MPQVDGLGVSQAAARLGLSEQRVRALLSSGGLAGAKVAGRWFVDPISVERWQPRRNKRGRPLSPPNAWALLFALSGRHLEWLAPWDRSRLAAKLRGNWRQWAPRAQNRARIMRFRAHPGQLTRLQKNPQIVLSGVSAAREYGIDIVPRDELEGYVKEKSLRGLIQKYKLSPSARPNVVLHVVEGQWPFDKDEVFAPIAVVALDLCESEDPRSRRAGKKVLDRLSKVSGRIAYHRPRPPG